MDLTLDENALRDEGIIRSSEDGHETVRELRNNRIDITERLFKTLVRDLRVTKEQENMFNIIKDHNISPEYNKKLGEILKKTAEIHLKITQFFQMDRNGFFWLTNIYLPLLNEISLHGVISGQSKLAIEAATRQEKTRQIFREGITPDLCDGWFLKMAEKTTDSNKSDCILRTPLGETIYLSQIPTLNEFCGDANILVPDLFVEIKQDGKSNADKAKLHLLMGQSARLFADVVKQYPLIFGLTCEAHIITGYVAYINSNGTLKSSTISEFSKGSADPAAIRSEQNKIDQKIATEDNQEPYTQIPSYYQIIEPLLAPNSQDELTGAQADPALPVHVHHLWTVDLNDPTNYMLLAGHLAKVYKIRLNQFRNWRESDAVKNLPFQKPEQKQSQKPNEDIIDANESYSSSSSGSGCNQSTDKNNEHKTPTKLIDFLSKYGFTPRDGYNLSGGNTFVFRGCMTESGSAAMFKGFKYLDDFAAELFVYEHLMKTDYKHMPKMFKYEGTEDLCYIIAEDLGDESLKFYTKNDVKLFALDLLTAVDALHKRRVIHGDLKPSNLRYLKDKRIVKVFDFTYSSSVKYTHLAAECLGYTHGYVSPEVLATNQVTIADDMFSVGMILASIVYEFKPKNDDDYKRVRNKIESNELTPLCSPSMLDLIDQLLKPATERISAKQALDSRLFVSDEI